MQQAFGTIFSHCDVSVTKVNYSPLQSFYQLYYMYHYCYFFQALAEEKAISERNAQERDAAESRARQAETKSLSISRELEEALDKLSETERSRKQLQSELDNLLESKDDVGKSVSC